MLLQYSVLRLDNSKARMKKIILITLCYIQILVAGETTTISMTMNIFTPTCKDGVPLKIHFDQVAQANQPHPSYIFANQSEYLASLTKELSEIGVLKKEALQHAHFIANVQRADYQARQKKAAAAAQGAQLTIAADAQKAAQCKSSATQTPSKSTDTSVSRKKSLKDRCVIL